MLVETALVRGRMPGGVGGQRREPLPTRLEMNPENNTQGAEHRDI